jgi:hypothetical protein
MGALFHSPTGRRFYRDLGGSGTVGRDTARDMAEVDTDAELDAAVAAKEIGAPIMSASGERYFPAELRAYAERKRYARNRII